MAKSKIAFSFQVEITELEFTRLAERAADHFFEEFDERVYEVAGVKYDELVEAFYHSEGLRNSVKDRALQDGLETILLNYNDYLSYDLPEMPEWCELMKWVSEVNDMIILAEDEESWMEHKYALPDPMGPEHLAYISKILSREGYRIVKA